MFEKIKNLEEINKARKIRKERNFLKATEVNFALKLFFVMAN